jgi:hypothetical protein
MRLIILLGTLAIALPFAISGAATRFGNAVSWRFLERPTLVKPSRYTVPNEAKEGAPLEAKFLAEWIQGKTASAAGYATRVIPLDVLYLIFLGLFLGFASSALAEMIRWPGPLATVSTWIWWLLPAVYIFCDFVEDSMIFSMLTWPSTIESLFNYLAPVRFVKICSVSLGMAQVILLSLLSFILVPSPKL